MTLQEFVGCYAVRGTCRCGQCVDAPVKEEQPKGHTADLMFFEVAAVFNPQPEQFLELVKKEVPQLLDGKEHSYLEVGALMGDQGLGLVTMGLGSLLGAWELLTPRRMLGKLGLPDEVLMEMAWQGLITVVGKADAKGI